MGLLDVAVLVGTTGGVGRGLQAIVAQQALVVARELMMAIPVEVAHGRREVVRAMPGGHAAQLPQRCFQPLGQGLKTLGEADPHGLHIGEGQRQVEQQVREGGARQRDVQGIHGGEVGLRHAPGDMLLREHYLPLRPLLYPPGLHVALQGAQLPLLIATRKGLAQQRKQRLRLQGWIARQLRLHPRPVLGKRVLPGAMLPRLLHLAGQLPGLLVLAGRALTHSRPGRRHLLADPFSSFA